MATVYLLCGKVASGKTTYAQKIRAKMGAVILSHDELMLLLYDGCLGENHAQTVERICVYFYQLSEQLLASGLDVMLDFGYWHQAEREKAKAYYAKVGQRAELIYFDLAEEERLARLEVRNKALAGAKERVYIIDSESLARLDGQFETPSDEEIDLRLTD